MTFAYTRDIPFQTHNPSADQPNMLINTNSTDSLINKDHYSFNQSFGGLHKQCTFPVQTAPTTAAGQLAIYSKTGTSGTELYMIRDNVGATETRLTTAGVTAPSRTQNGYSWLPGGILLQWGFKVIPSGSTTITFTTEGCVAFANVGGFAPIVTLGILKTVGVNNNSQVFIGATAFTGFTVFSNDANNIAIYWHAIGPI